MEQKDYKWGFSNTSGYYPGFKLTLAIEYPSLVPLAFLIHPGSPHDSSLFTEIMNELIRRRIAKIGDTVVFDRGYYSYNNYVMGVRDYQVVPVIFPKKKFDISKVLSKMNYPLRILSNHGYQKIQKNYQLILHKMITLIEKWNEFPAIRSVIEDIFKLAKDAFSLRELHRYSAVSVKKFIALNVLLVGMTIICGNDKKKLIQKMSEW